MLTGTRVLLRAREQADVAILHRELYDDVSTRIRGDTRPWLPLPADSVESPYAVAEHGADVAFFSVAHAETGELAGEAIVYGIDSHNRSGHLGLALRPSSRGQGLSRDTLALLCRYGFAVRGLHRLQLETLAENEPMIRAARSAGFREEGRRVEARWVEDCFVDELIFARLG